MGPVLGYRVCHDVMLVRSLDIPVLAFVATFGFTKIALETMILPVSCVYFIYQRPVFDTINILFSTMLFVALRQ